MRGLRHAVDGVEILRGLDLEVSERRIGIVGRNGSGKTTLARALCGLVDIQGHLRVAGVDVARDRRGALGAVGLLFQNPDHQIIFPTVAEELSFGLRQQGLARDAVSDRVARTLSAFQRSDWADRSIHDMSHGQKQLVCLMAILAMAPEVVVLDEPFAGLDIPLRMRLARVLDGIGSAVVHISHAPEDLLGCDRVIWLEDGRIAADGGPAVLSDYAAHMRKLGETEC
ncbi:ABC transporter ATP-binding protein [Maribius pontilimi]|uniref:ABC transporter ATP-binding protein n=2 Tax=Palleronia pontilimi TaxID=1964209 RepID=A0A934MB42_9RHOB|nr:ABC transporter ATP-binding protein [Palleronia pontilimi]